MLALCGSLHEYEHTNNHHPDPPTSSGCGGLDPDPHHLETLDHDHVMFTGLWMSGHYYYHATHCIASTLFPCSYSADLFRVMTQDYIHGPDPGSSECGHSINCGYATLKVTQSSMPTGLQYLGPVATL